MSKSSSKNLEEIWQYHINFGKSSLNLLQYFRLRLSFGITKIFVNLERRNENSFTKVTFNVLPSLFSL